MVANQRNTCREKYGAENIMQSPAELQKIRMYLKEPTGFASPFENPSILQKCQASSMERYGVNHPLQSGRIYNKTSISYEKNHGHKNIMKEAHIVGRKLYEERKILREQEVRENQIKTRRQFSSAYQKDIHTVKPYTYLIKYKPTGQVYYGVRSKNVKLGLTAVEDFMIVYRTHCKPLIKLFKNNDLSNFEYEIRRTFDTAEQAYYWEQMGLQRCKVVNNPIWFNQSAAGHSLNTEEGKKKISERHQGKPKSKEHRNKIAAALTGRSKSAAHKLNISQSKRKKLIV